MRSQIQALLMEVTLQSASLKSELQQFDELDPTDTRDLELRLVSAESAQLYQALKEADQVYAKLNFAHNSEKLTLRARGEMTKDFELAFADLKRFVVGGKIDKTANELGREIGVT